MNRPAILLVACALLWIEPIPADDVDAYLISGGHDGVYVNVVMDTGDTALDAAVCTYGVDCGPPFTTEQAHRHLGDMFGTGEPVTAPGMFRAVLSAVIEEPQLDEIRLSLMIANHHDNPREGAEPGTGGGTVLKGYGRLAEQRGAILQTLKAVPTLASPAAHLFQPREIYLEWLSYIAGDDVLLGQNSSGNFGREDPHPDYDGGVISGTAYLSPFGDGQSCPALYSILFTQGESERDHDLDGALATQLPLPGDSSLERLLAYLHESDTDLLPRSQASVPLQKTWVVTSRDRVGQSDEQARTSGAEVLYLDDPARLQHHLTMTLANTLARGSHSMGAVAVDDTFRAGRVLEDLFIPLFSPEAGARWAGNLKKLKVRPAASVDANAPAESLGQVVDVRGLPAIETSGEYKGQIQFDALTFWTDVASLPQGDGQSVPLRADGRVVARGGAGQKIDGFVNYTADVDLQVQYFIGDTNTDSPAGGYGPRQLYYESAAGLDFKPFDAAAATVAELRPALDPLGEADDDALINLIRWARGQDTGNETSAPRHWILGEILHSRPLALNYGATRGYSQSNPNIRLLFGSGEGIFHIIENTDPLGRESGRELFGFYPHEMLSVLAAQRAADPGVRVYGVDGSPVLLKRDRNRDGTLDHTDGDTAWVYFGLRRGGSAYYALDVSDPDALPRLMWKIKPTRGGAFDALGMTFSTPVVARVNYSGTPEDVLIFSGGYHGGWNDDHTARIGKDLGAEDDSIGNAIFIVSARTGELVWKAELGTTGASSNVHYEHAGLVDSIPAEVTALVSPDGIAHRLYVGDTGGAIWRVDLPPSQGEDDNHRMNHWFITKLADLGADAAESGGSNADDRRFFHAPDVVQSYDDGGAYDGVLIQSGDREHPNETAVENALFLIRDRQVASGDDVVRAENETARPAGRLQYADLADRTACIAGDAASIAAGEDNSCGSLASAAGWKVRYNRPGEKGVSPVLVDGGRVFASTFVPGSASSCPATPGRGQLYVLRLADAAAVANQQRIYDLGVGIPDAVATLGENLLLPGGGADLYDLDDDGTRDSAKVLPSQAVKRYRTYWREPGVDPL
jgi:type IV pilus assembly protein PilY1